MTPEQLKKLAEHVGNVGTVGHLDHGTDITKLAREILKFNILPYHQRPHDELCEIAYLSKQLAQEIVGSTVKGERMPQTPEEFAAMGDKYEKAMLREKDINSKLRARINELEQKAKAIKGTT